tara:strand:- start:7868 stop:8758 length:891 start_codon:yes stop_codon:yes gene_type:complete
MHLPNLTRILMHFKDTELQLSKIIEGNINSNTKEWLADKITTITNVKSTKDLYLTYSLLASKIDVNDAFDTSMITAELKKYIQIQNGNLLQIARMYLLIKVLEADEEFFSEKVANIIEVADTSELVTFLKFLILLPNAEKYKMVAVDALRTNISPVFNALAYNNPYPSSYFDDRQWNQMFLKTAFMQGNLSAILNIDKRANKDLARIISDYAHERWAAGRDIDPDFWRPVIQFIGPELIEDMKRLLNSKSKFENRAGALCCYFSNNPDAKKILNGHQNLIQQIENAAFSWETIKEE